jgi:hypothetical protein
MRSPLAAVLLVVVVGGCDHSSGDGGRRERLIALIDTLPRLEAEERAWPRAPSLACDERAAGRVREIAEIRAAIEEAARDLPGRAELAPVFAACDELQGCARCDEGFRARCSRTRELLVDVQLALTKAGLRR